MAYLKTGNKPYLIDIHVHGADDYDTRTRRQDDILRIASLHGERGTNAILPTVYAGTLPAMRENLGAVRRALEARRQGAEILGVHLEGPFLNPERAGSLDGKSFADPSLETLSLLIEDFEDIARCSQGDRSLPGKGYSCPYGTQRCVL
jgi:N-acetylglucosamine-6-phosphate deacetylase